MVVVRDIVGGNQLDPKSRFDDRARCGICQLGTLTVFVMKVDGALTLFGPPWYFSWRGAVFVQNVGSKKRVRLETYSE